jgi:hypothetical protein
MTEISSIKVLNQNIRSLRKNFDLFLSHLESEKLSPDIIVLTEIWVNRDEINFYKIPGYNVYSRCNESYRSGGVAVYIRDCYRCDGARERDDVASADCVQLDCQASDLDRFTLLAVYRLHSSSPAQFISDMEVVFDELEGQNIVYAADGNINIISQSSEADAYLEFMSSRGMLSLVNEPTRILGNSESCIDHTFIRFFNKTGQSRVTNTTVFHFNITDHSTVVSNISLLGKIPNISQNKIIKKLDLTKLTSSLHNADWGRVFKQITVSDAFSTFFEILNYFVAKSEVQIKFKKGFVKIKPWMTNNLLLKIQKRKSIYKQLISNPNNMRLKKYYINFRNKLNVEIKLTKEQFYKLKFDRNSGNMKGQWNIVNELIGESSRTNDISEIHGRNGVINEEIGIANEFNEFFLDVAEAIKPKSTTKYLPPEYNETFRQKTFYKSSFFMAPTTPEEILSIINKLKNGKAPGYDQINSSIIKKIAPEIINVLSYLFNFSLASGEFPQCLKRAVVIPIFKRGDNKQPGSYRPISLLSVFAKILEKIVKIRLINFFDKNSFFSNNQFGFRQGLSTESALITFMESTYSLINSGKLCSALFIDITKAFDTVDHKILLKKLWNAGVRGLPYQWFSSYLIGRNQCVRIGDSVSNFGVLNCGVPQGSVLGPILFLIYINDLCNGTFNGQLVAFADDTAFIYGNENIQELHNKMSIDLYLLRLWFDSNYMVLSEKTKFMIFSLRDKLSFQLPLKYHEIDCSKSNVTSCTCLKLDQVNCMKYLGLLIDENLSWKSHVSKLKKELFLSLRKFYLLRHLCPVKVLCCIYHALVGSRISYGIACWGGAYASTLYPVITLQKRFVRIISGKDRFEHAWPLFVSLKIFPLRNLYVFKVLKMFFIRSSSYCIKRTCMYNLRRQDTIFVPKSNLTLYQNFYTCSAPRLFNKIKLEIGNFFTDRHFFSKLKNWLFTQENIYDYLRIQT